MNGPGTIIIGAGGHARVVVDILRSCGQEIAALLDQQQRVSEMDGIRVLSRFDEALTFLTDGRADRVMVAIGDNWVRSQVVLQSQEQLPSVRFRAAVHPEAVIAGGVEVGPGTVVMAGAVVGVGTILGAHCIVNTRASIDHDCILEPFSSVAPGATLGGEVILGSHTAVGIGATIIHGRQVGAHAVVGAGAVVTRDIPASVVAYGVPARVIRKRDLDEPYLLAGAPSE